MKNILSVLVENVKLESKPTPQTDAPAEKMETDETDDESEDESRREKTQQPPHPPINTDYIEANQAVFDGMFEAINF